MATERESTVVARWLGAVSLVAAAEDASRAKDGALNIVAVASAHSAAEVALGLIADNGSGEPPPRIEDFRHLLARATAALPGRRKWPDRLAPDLVNLNDVRNMALHRGIAVADVTALDATLVARTLLEFLPQVINVKALPKGAGVTRAVAERVEDKQLRGCLERAEDHFRSHDHLEAADDLSGAFGLLMSRANLPRRDPFSRSRFRVRAASVFGRDPVSVLAKELEREIEPIASAVHRNDEWIRRIGLGLSRANLARLDTILGSAHWSEGRSKAVRYDVPDPSVEDVAWAMARVTEIVYRLWVGGSLELSAWERELDARDRARADLTVESASQD